jgi:phosphate transport system protein
MLRESLDAFVERDAAARRGVCCSRDDEVDAAVRQRPCARVFAWMRDHPEEIPVGQAVVSVAKYLERVADHATNLAEQVVFMVRGDDVRHRRARGEGRDP